MTNEVLIHIPNELLDVIREFDDDYLADVLRPWDCYRQNWADDSFFLLRFESDDFLIWLSEEVFYKRGSIDTSYFDIDKYTEILGAESNNLCICWLHDKAYGPLIGFKFKDISLHFTKEDAGDRYLVLFGE